MDDLECMEFQYEGRNMMKTSTKNIGIYDELPQEIPEVVRKTASSIYQENVDKTTRGENRKFIKYTCVCIAIQQSFPESYDPYKIADLFDIKHDNIGKAFRSARDLYDSHRELTRVTPMKILKSRISEFGFDNNEDFFSFAKEFIDRHGKSEAISNVSPLNIAAGIFAYYCDDIAGLGSKIPTHTIGIVFNVSEQIVSKRKEEMKRLDN